MPEDVLIERVRFPVEERTVPGYLALPARTGRPNPAGVVVVQEWWGLVEHIEDVADRFAAAGYLALAPDLYDGAATEEPDGARKLAMGLDRERALRDLEAAVAYLTRRGARKVGVTGFCMGGGLVLELATRSEDLAAVVAWYGRPLPPEHAATVRCPVLGLYGGADTGIPLASVRALEQALRAVGKEAEFIVYPGVPHAFFNDRRESYREDAARDGWQRALAFFAGHLR